VMGGFELVDHSSQESIEYSTVLGDFQGDISLPTSGTILGLAIEGNLGYAATPVTVTSGNIKSLEVAGTAYAAITAGGSGLIQRFTTGSSFVGSISAVNFAAVGGGATGIVIGNECAATSRSPGASCSPSPSPARSGARSRPSPPRPTRPSSSARSRPRRGPTRRESSG